VHSLPFSLWRPANLFVGYRLHFRTGPSPDGDLVGTVEWNGREIAHGRRPFPYDDWFRRWPSAESNHD
jgi:hypothetical protein